MKYLFSILPLLFLLTSRSCDDKVTETPDVNQFGQTVEITYGEKAAIGDGLTATFSTIADNRCPKDVQCIVAGEAKVDILLEKGDQNGKVTLSAKGLCMDRTGKCGNAGNAMGYMVKLLSVDPYPEEGQRMDKAKMKVRLVVNKGKK